MSKEEKDADTMLKYSFDVRMNIEVHPLLPKALDEEIDIELIKTSYLKSLNESMSVESTKLMRMYAEEIKGDE